jgi:hypothetical protein
LVDVDFELVKQLLVDLLVLLDEDEDFVDLVVEVFVGFEADVVLFTELLLLSHDFLELGLLDADVGLEVSQFGTQLFAFVQLVGEIGCVKGCIVFVLFSLLKEILMGDFELIDVVL